jgi:hypothetical protein
VRRPWIGTLSLRPAAVHESSCLGGSGDGMTTGTGCGTELEVGAVRRNGLEFEVQNNVFYSKNQCEPFLFFMELEVGRNMSSSIERIHIWVPQPTNCVVLEGFHLSARTVRTCIRCDAVSKDGDFFGIKPRFLTRVKPRPQSIIIIKYKEIIHLVSTTQWRKPLQIYNTEVIRILVQNPRKVVVIVIHDSIG